MCRNSGCAKMTALALVHRTGAVLLSGFAGLLLFGCFASGDPDPLQPHLSHMVQEKSAAAVKCNQEIDALWKLVATQETRPCVKEKIIKPLNGICATNGLGRECILALDQGALCLPDGPTLPECNRLATMENQFTQLGAYRLETN